jgi:hypothetical protein
MPARWTNSTESPAARLQHLFDTTCERRERNHGLPLSPKGIAQELAKRFPFRSFATFLDRIEIETQRMSDVENRSAIARALLEKTQVYHLDIGSRGGPRPEIGLFAEFFTITLCEPDSVEAEKLRQCGYEIIERAFWSKADDELQLQVLRAASNSSVFKPNARAMRYWLGSMEKLEPQYTETLRTTTIGSEEEARGIRFDDVKIDTEGADFEVLKGLGNSQPFFVQSEVNRTRLRNGQGLLHDISALLFDRGYLMADICFRRFNGMGNGSALPNNRRSSRGIGMTGDAYFIADWTRDKGRAIIERAPRTWAALMVLKGYEDLVRWICEHDSWHALSDIGRTIEEAGR